MSNLLATVAAMGIDISNGQGVRAAPSRRSARLGGDELIGAVAPRISLQHRENRFVLLERGTALRQPPNVQAGTKELQKTKVSRKIPGNVRQTFKRCKSGVSPLENEDETSIAKPFGLRIKFLSCASRRHLMRHPLTATSHKSPVRSACGGFRWCRRRSRRAWHRAAAGRPGIR
jgi:hypothetical protein